MKTNEPIKEFWVAVSAYYRQQVPLETIKLYAYDCRDVSLEDLRIAFEQYRTSKQASFFPIPAVLKNLIRPPFDEEAEANEVVSRIMQCLSPFKSTQDAQEHMGALAWEVVKSMGGWQWFGSQPPPNSFIQNSMRDMARSKIVRAHQGRTNEVPALEGSSRPQIGQQTNKALNSGVSKVMSLVSDTMKDKSIK